MSLKIVSRRNKPLGEFPLNGDATVADLKNWFAKKHHKNPNRQYFTQGLGKTAVKVTEDENTLMGDYNLKGGDQLYFKDLGYQVSWRFVFIVEYGGPLLLHALFFFVPALYGVDKVEHQPVQQIGFACVMFHYLKREFETVFVHRFSNATMPWFNIIKNSTHYWILSGVFIAYPLYHPLYTNSLDMPVVYTFVVLFLIAELGNGHAHIIQRNLRPPGTRKRAIPYGQLFELVSCANYTWEILAWCAFAYFTQLLTAWLFVVVSTGQIAVWALKKHKRYHKEFPNYPRNRKALVPFLF